MGRSMVVLAATLLASGCGAFDWNGPGTRCAAMQNGGTWCVTKDAQNNVVYSGPGPGTGPATVPDPTGALTIWNGGRPVPQLPNDPTGRYSIMNVPKGGMTCTQTGRTIDCQPK